jgi:hypothetical protein
MSFYHGKSTKVMLGAVDLSPYLTSMDLAADADVADTTTYAAAWKSGLTGAAGAKVDFGGLYDPGEASLPTLFLTLLPGVLTYCPVGGAAIGDRARLVSAIEAAYAESSPVGGAVAVKGSFMADGTVGFGDVLHPLAEDTNNTTGANRDDGAGNAPSSTGWTMHLHVTAVDAGSWVVKLVDASASDFSDVADVSGGAFTAATGATSQRLQSAAITTDLRRYVRYVATRTGGSAGDGITFFLAYSRNK